MVDLYSNTTHTVRITKATRRDIREAYNTSDQAALGHDPRDEIIHPVSFADNAPEVTEWYSVVNNQTGVIESSHQSLADAMMSADVYEFQLTHTPWRDGLKQALEFSKLMLGPTAPAAAGTNDTPLN